MPTRPASPCLTPRCPGLATYRGRCAQCNQGHQRQRGSAHSRGYTSYWQNVFRPQFIQMLIAEGIVPVCGAALPGGPRTQDSQCRADGHLTFTSSDGSALHLDHEPPLTDAERQNRAAVCDPMRVRLLCASCHSGKTQREVHGMPA